MDNKFANVSVIIRLLPLRLTLYWPPLQVILGTTTLTIGELSFLALIGVADLGIIELIKAISHKFK